MLRFAAGPVALCFTVVNAGLRCAPPPGAALPLGCSEACDAQSHSRPSGEAQSEDLALSVGLPRPLAMHRICIFRYTYPVALPRHTPFDDVAVRVPVWDARCAVEALCSVAILRPLPPAHRCIYAQRPLSPVSPPCRGCVSVTRHWPAWKKKSRCGAGAPEPRTVPPGRLGSTA